jgi:hypothetical protein
MELHDYRNPKIYDIILYLRKRLFYHCSDRKDDADKKFWRKEKVYVSVDNDEQKFPQISSFTSDPNLCVNDEDEDIEDNDE